jgi:hypothetical protein
MSDTQQIIIDLYHPAFRQGFLEGRRDGFQEQGVLINKQFVEELQELFEDIEQDGTNKKWEGIYYPVGYFIGQVSSCAIPRQSDEDATRKRQEAFLLQFRKTCQATEEILVEKIQQFWTIQGELSQMLDSGSFSQMLDCSA